MAVGSASVGEGIVRVGAGSICAVGDSTAVAVFAGFTGVNVGNGVGVGSRLISNVPQAVRSNSVRNTGTLFAFIGAPVGTRCTSDFKQDTLPQCFRGITKL